MAALLVALSVMSIMLAVALPVWRQMIQREKEAELIFRGQQYARAIGLFQRKYANAFPPSVDVLVEQRFLRKKYKDPITGDDFQVLNASSLTPSTPQAGAPLGTTGIRPGLRQSQGSTRSQTPATALGTSQPTGPVGGVVGVASKSKAKSIRLYNGRDRYNEWHFVYTPITLRPGGAPGTQQPGRTPGPQQPGSPPRPGTRPGMPVTPLLPPSPRSSPRPPL